MFRGSFTVDPARVADVMSLNEREAIRDPRLLVKCGVVLLAGVRRIHRPSVIHIEPSVVALLGAGVLILISRVDREDYLGSVEWETLLFFAGLFILVGALVKTGVDRPRSPGWPRTSPVATRCSRRCSSSSCPRCCPASSTTSPTSRR